MYIFSDLSRTDPAKGGPTCYRHVSIVVRPGEGFRPLAVICDHHRLAILNGTDLPERTAHIWMTAGAKAVCSNNRVIPAASVKIVLFLTQCKTLSLLQSMEFNSIQQAC